MFLISPESVDDHNLFRCLVSLINVLVECGMKENIADIDHLLMSDVIAVRIIGGGGGLSSQLVNEVIVKENRYLSFSPPEITILYVSTKKLLPTSMSKLIIT